MLAKVHCGLLILSIGQTFFKLWGKHLLFTRIIIFSPHLHLHHRMGQEGKIVGWFVRHLRQAVYILTEWECWMGNTWFEVISRVQYFPVQPNLTISIRHVITALSFFFSSIFSLQLGLGIVLFQAQFSPSHLALVQRVFFLIFSAGLLRSYDNWLVCEGGYYWREQIKNPLSRNLNQYEKTQPKFDVGSSIQTSSMLWVQHSLSTSQFVLPLILNNHEFVIL